MNGNYTVNLDTIGLSFDDFIKMKDKSSITGDHPYLRGHVVFRDPDTGEVLHEDDNLIVLRSRAYILELLFNLTSPSTIGYIPDKTRTVSLFEIGSGGADVQSSPFEVVAPKFNNVGLYQPIPFVIEDPNKNIDPQKKANPSYIERLSDEEKHIYYLPGENVDGSIEYYAKEFQPESKRIVVNPTTNQCYVTMNLEISTKDARGNAVNELGLILCKYNEEENIYENAELFSHITFETIALKSLKRRILINYSVYA